MESGRRRHGSTATAGASLPYLCILRVERVLDRLSRAISWFVVVVVLAVICGTCAFYVTVLLPQLRFRLPRSLAILHASASAWLLLSVLVNYVMALAVPPGHPRTLPPDDDESPIIVHDAIDNKSYHPFDSPYLTTSQRWRWCKVCHGPKPPRTHHDSTTGRCVLQMCHYCPAVAQVVGLRNYQHFGRFVLYTWLAGLYTAASCAWLHRRLPAELSKGWHGDAVFFCGVACAAIGVAVGVLVAFHVYLVMTGQTTVEFYENWSARRAGLISKPPFDGGVRVNVEAAFGKPYFRLLPWWSVLILPDWRKLPIPLWMLYPPTNDVSMQLD